MCTERTKRADCCLTIGEEKVRFIFWMLLTAGAACFSGCSSQPSHDTIISDGLLSPQIQEAIRTVASSVVGITVYSDYRLELFHHELRGGRLIPDLASPTGYRLRAGELGITATHKSQDVFGAGIVLFQEARRALILTSRHILQPTDTVRSFALDSAGNSTDILYSRAVRTRSTFQIVGASGHWFAAEVLKTDSLSDLGLMLVSTEGVVGRPFSYNVAYDRKMEWGDLVFAFGNPRGFKQLTIGVTSPSPYPGTFAMDAAARYGFSGGPVLVVSRQGEIELSGVVRGAQINRFQYVTPPPDVLPGEHLSQDDLKELKAEEYTMIEYGISYAVDAEAIGTFLTSSIQTLQSKGISLSNRFYPKR